MFEIFKYVDNFFTSLTQYLTYNYIFIIFVGLFIVAMFFVVFFTARSYEARLIKTVDKFNSYFIDNPQINEENLVLFNQKMKHKNVPKQLRKNWQQFVLYRENKASTYMSFENCVSNPIKNSTYTRDVKLMGTLAWILSLCSLILNCYYCYEVTDISAALSRILLTPIVILLLNYIVQIFLNMRHSAIVSDLFQNYQYFEVNIDKATETLPEYVDYEVLFDRNEIKKGIPILYAFLQKRAEEEQRQLETARLKNVEHEKFNFDDQGIAASLVLERAMQEAENYIAERKKYTQDIGQINADITQEDLNYREITKEYNRQMQVSKETFANFKSQLEDVSSTIEANYLKKQQQQELDRQRNLERDFDTATEKHKKVIDGYQAELDTIDKFIAKSRKNLEDAMKSEFSTYSSKVYDEAKKLVEERVKGEMSKNKSTLTELEEKLVARDQELQTAYENNQKMSDKLEKLLNENRTLIEVGRKNKKFKREIMNITSGYDQESIDNIQKLIDDNSDNNGGKSKKITITKPQSDNGGRLVDEELEFNTDYNANDLHDDYLDNEFEEDYFEEDNENLYQNNPITNQSHNLNAVQNAYYDELQDENYNEQLQDEYYDEFEEEELAESSEGVEEYEEVQQPTENLNYGIKSETEKVEDISTKHTDDSMQENSASKGETPVNGDNAEKVQVIKKKPGRPRKPKTEATQPKRGRGRPRKVETEEESEVKVKKGPGRPRKEVGSDEPKAKKGPGRPRKVETEAADNEPKIKRGPGRPRKVTSNTENDNVNTGKRGRGRPKKEEMAVNDINNIDAYLKELDEAIAAENAKLEKTQQELAKEARLKTKK